MAKPLFYVGFYSPSEPGNCQIWRPKDDSPEKVSMALASKRFERLAKSMASKEKVDGLRVASVALFDAKGSAIRSRTADGTEAESRPYDFGAFLQMTPSARAVA